MADGSNEMLDAYSHQSRDADVTWQDQVLLDRFVSRQDEAAFELLLARHGPMVLGTARRLVGNSQDADDVFQAVFLSLAQLAKTIRQANTLPAWLHKATCRVAVRVRNRRGLHTSTSCQEPIASDSPEVQLVWREVCQALDEELEQLPERLRSPLLLCYLSGFSRDEAAEQLGWSLSTLKRRLEEGRNMLRVRLDRRGITAVGLALSVILPERLQAAVDPALLESSKQLVFTKAALPPTLATLVTDTVHSSRRMVMRLLQLLLMALSVGAGCYVSYHVSDPAGRSGEPNTSAPNPPGPPRQAPIVVADDQLPTGSTKRLGTARFRHSTFIENMAIASDEKTAFVGSGGRSFGSLRAIDLLTGRGKFDVGGDCDAIAIDPKGTRVVVKQAAILLILDAQTGRSLRQIARPALERRDSGDVIALTPDGNTIAITPDGTDCFLIDLTTGNTIRVLKHENPESTLGSSFAQIQSIAISSDGKYLATGGYANIKGNYFARIWDLAAGNELRRCMLGEPGYGVRSLAFSPDGKLLSTIGTQSGVIPRLFDVASGTEIRAFPKDGNQRTQADSIAFSPNGEMIAIAQDSIHMYDVVSGKERLRIPERAGNLHFSRDGTLLFGSVNATVYQWDVNTGESLIPESAGSSIEQILVTPDGKQLITREHDGTGYLWDINTAKRLRRIQLAYQRPAALSPDGQLLAFPISDASASFTDPRTPNMNHEGSKIRFYNLATHQTEDRFEAYQGNAQDVQFINNGKDLVTVDGYLGTVRIWNVQSRQVTRTFSTLSNELKEQEFFVRSARLSADGITAIITYEKDLHGALGGAKGPPQQVRIWDITTGKELPKISQGMPVYNGFSPDGRMLFAANSIFDRATGKLLVTLPSEHYAEDAAFSLNGTLLAVTNRQSVRIYETKTWKQLTELKGDGGRITALAFGPNLQLFSGSQDTTVLQWDLKPFVSNR